MTDEEIVKRAKDAEKGTNFGELVHSPISKGVNSAYGIGFIEGMVEYRNSMQEEPAKDRFAFKAIPRLLDMIEQTNKSKSYVTKLADALDSEGYYTDAKIVRERLKIMNGEKVPMATMDEEPVSEDLEEVIEKSFIYHENRGDDFRSDKQIATAYRYGFEAGAKWKEQQMMKGAVEAKVYNKAYPTEFEIETNTFMQKLKHGDNVKLIIIEEE